MQPSTARNRNPAMARRAALAGHARGTLLSAKLSPPAEHSTHIPRTALQAQLQASAGQLVLLHAPAGFGKTTLLRQARTQLEQTGIACAWLNLDRSDNDVARFTLCLEQAANQIGLTAAPNATVFDAAQPWQQAAAPFALFLDELEHVHEAAVLGIVRAIIAQLPPLSHVFIATRNLPQLGLARLRSRGQLLSLNAQDLRLTLSETQAFVRMACPQEPSFSTVQELHTRTEGWAAALRLACIAMARSTNAAQFVARFSGSERAMAEYLAEEVLQGQSPAMQEFLLKTSILRQLQPAICQVLLPQLDCQTLLSQLQDSALLLSPQAYEEDSWRSHSLLADYLRSQLQAQQPEAFKRLHASASNWFEVHGQAVAAMDHALEAQDHAGALRMLERHVDDFLQQGRMRLLARWLARIPETLLAPHPRLQAAAVWATCLSQGPARAETLLRNALQQHPGDPELKAHAAALWPTLRLMQDRNQEALALGRASLRALPQGKPFITGTLLTAMAHLSYTLEGSTAARALLQTARTHSQQGSRFLHMYTEATEGLLDLQAGRLRQAAARFRLAVDASHAGHSNQLQGNAWAGVFYAYTVYESQQWQRAEQLLGVYLPLAREVGLPDHMVLSYTMRARMAFAQGDVDLAQAVLIELEYLGHRRQIPRVSAAAHLEHARIYLLQGNAKAARQAMQQAQQGPAWEREPQEHWFAHETEYPALAEIRWQLHFGSPEQALALLAPEIQRAQTQHRERRTLLLQLLHSLALAHTQRPTEAAALLGQLLPTIAHEGYRRLVLDEGPAMGQWLKRCQQLGAEHTLRLPWANDPLQTETLNRLVQAFGTLPEDPAHNPDNPTAPQLEQLTRKELRILTLLAEGYSNSAMAEKLFISDSTVRTHLRQINRKLGAASRTQAVAIARKCGLVG